MYLMNVYETHDCATVAVTIPCTTRRAFRGIDNLHVAPYDRENRDVSMHYIIHGVYVIVSAEENM
jgi:hypothetical protein